MNLLTNDEPVWTVTPIPVFCVKTKNLDDNEKVFLNFCVCDELPAPKDISELELAEILESEDPGSFKIPLSLGEARRETDKSGVPCTAYDVIINGRFYRDKVADSQLFRTFSVLVAVDALFDKYKTKVDKQNWIVLKNRKNVGVIQSQNIRRRPKPVIVELDYEKQPSSVAVKRPEFVLKKDSARNPSKLSGEFRLPGVKNAREIQLNIGEDRISLKVPGRYSLDICIPFDIAPDSAVAEFSTADETLSLEAPLKK